ncbi:MAG: mechanosensitive ion channel domain-containing protein [Ferruginibacter sp.]
MKWDWQKIYNTAYNWIITHAPGIIGAAVVLVTGIAFIRILNKWLKRWLEHRHFNPSLRSFLQNLIIVVLQIFLILLVMQVAGIQLTFLSAIIAGFTVAAGLALSGTLQNFVSGILILFLRPYKVGDNINVQGNEGTVTSIQLFFTTVVTFDNKTIIVPNGQLSNNIVINLSQQGKRRLDIDLKLSYENDIAQVKSILNGTIKNFEHILAEPASRIGISLLEYEMYTISVNVWIDAHGFYDTRLLFQEKIITDLIKAGIKFPVK